VLSLYVDRSADWKGSNREQLELIRQMGVRPPKEEPKHHSRLKVAGLAVIATLKMKRWKEEWDVNKRLHSSLVAKLNEMNRHGLRKNKSRTYR
jgi:hypothetical protein